MSITNKPTVDEVKIQQNEAVIAEVDKAISELSQVQALKAENEALKMKAAEVETIKVEANKVVKNALREQNVGLSMAGSYNSKLSDDETQEALGMLMACQVESKLFKSDYSMSAMQSISRELMGSTSLGERLNSKQYSIAGGFGTQNYVDISLPFNVIKTEGVFTDNSTKVQLQSISDKMVYEKIVTGSINDYNEVQYEGSKQPIVQNQLIRFEAREESIGKIMEGIMFEAGQIDDMTPEKRVKFLSNIFPRLENMHLEKRARFTTHRQADQQVNITPAIPVFDAPFLAKVNFVELSDAALYSVAGIDPYYTLWNSIQSNPKDAYIVRKLGFTDYNTPSANIDAIKDAITVSVEFLQKKSGSAGKQISLVIGSEMQKMLRKVKLFYGDTLNSSVPYNAVAEIEALGIKVIYDKRLDDRTGGAANPVAFLGYIDEYYVTATAPIGRWFQASGVLQLNGFDLEKIADRTVGYRKYTYELSKETGFGAKIRDSSAAVFLTLQA